MSPSPDGAEGTANLRSRVPVDAHLVDQAVGLHVDALGPVEARCPVMGTRPDATAVRVALYDVGVDDRMVALASVTVRPV